MNMEMEEKQEEIDELKENVLLDNPLSFVSDDDKDKSKEKEKETRL